MTGTSLSPAASMSADAPAGLDLSTSQPAALTQKKQAKKKTKPAVKKSFIDSEATWSVQSASGDA